MTGSPRRRTAVALASSALALASWACRTPPAGLPPVSAFDRDVVPAPTPPDVADRAAAEAARAALLSDGRRAHAAARRLKAIDTVLAVGGQPPTGLVPAALDLVHTTLDDPRSYRRATRALLTREGTDPALHARLELFVEDAPLALASTRLREDRMLEFGRAFNAVAEPLGRSLVTFSLAPYRLGRSALEYALALYERDPLPLRQRQALHHWEEFLERYPDAEEAEELTTRVTRAQARLRETLGRHSRATAKRALREGRHRLALIYADRALRYMPEDRESERVRSAAEAALLRQREERARSVSASPHASAALPAREARALARALLAPGADLEAAARALEAADTSGELADEARFARAVALGEAGSDEAMWDELEALARQPSDASNMARHAQAAVFDPAQNRYGAFRRTLAWHRRNRALWVVLGPFAAGIPDRGLPGPLDWVVGAPALAEAILGTPVRLIELPWSDALSSSRNVASRARAYLQRHPDGERAEELRGWLLGYEKRRKNWLGSLRVAEEDGETDAEELAELREKAGGQWLDAAFRERDRALRLGMYRDLAEKLPQTRAASEAARRIRKELEQATALEVRISREFLLENPQVAGPAGLALKPALLDGDPANAELHPRGVTLLGNLEVDVHYLDSGGDEEAPPRSVRETLDDERLARVVSQLEETAFRNELVDPLASVGADADRDAFFERARLGLAERADIRSGAHTRYTYLGLRERYGMVRARESILPFDIVLQGSLSDLSLGGFPRFRPPRETPDAILFK